MERENRIAINSAWIVIGKVTQIFVGVIIGMLTTRYLGPSNYGLINLGGSYISFFTPLYTLGLSGILVNELIKRPDKKGEILGSAIALRLIGSFVSALLIIAWVYIANPSDSALLVVSALQCIAIFFQWSDLFNYWCQSELNSKAAVIIQLIAYLVASAYKIWLLATEKSVAWFAISISFDYILQAIAYLFYFKKRTGQSFLFKISTATELLKNSYHYIFSAFGAVLYAQTDKLMLGYYLNTQIKNKYVPASKKKFLFNLI